MSEDSVKELQSNLDGMDLEKLENREKVNYRNLEFEENEKKKQTLKTLGILVIIGLGFFGIVKWLGPWSLFGLLSFPIWAFYFYYKFKADDILLWEVRIPGQKFKTPNGEVEVKDRLFRRWRIPPLHWKHHKKDGEIFHFGNLYLSNFYDPEQSFVSFGYMKATNNMLRYYDAIWNWMIDIIPKLQSQLGLYKEASELKAMKKAVVMLVKIGAMEPLYLEGKKLREKTIQKKGPGVT